MIRIRDNVRQTKTLGFQDVKCKKNNPIEKKCPIEKKKSDWKKKVWLEKNVRLTKKSPNSSAGALYIYILFAL